MGDRRLLMGDPFCLCKFLLYACPVKLEDISPGSFPPGQTVRQPPSVPTRAGDIILAGTGVVN